MTKRMATSKRSGTPRHSTSSRRIIVVVVPPVDELDLVGPLQVFNSVNRLAGRKAYAIEVVTNGERLIVEGEGGVLTFMARNHFNKVEGACDSVLLVCGLGSRAVRDAALSDWLNKMAAEVRRLGAVCVGAFLLAEAGLLNDRRATTHWRFGREMATRYPGVRVQHDPLWVKDGNIYTSAGISAGIDLALAWVEEDCGAGLAHEAARELVLFLRRPGGQPQVSVSLSSQASDSRGGHDTVAIRSSDARRGCASSARTHRERAQAGGLGKWIRECRPNEARLRSAAGDHPAPLPRPRGPFDRRMKPRRLAFFKSNTTLDAQSGSTPPDWYRECAVSHKWSSARVVGNPYLGITSGLPVNQTLGFWAIQCESRGIAPECGL